MITCPNCNHQNPDGALQCEACYTPLPALVACPSCNTPVQVDASFCGQCGADLRAKPSPTTAGSEGSHESASGSASEGLAGTDLEIPDLVSPDPLVVPEPLGSTSGSPSSPVSVPEPISEQEQEPVVFISEPVEATTSSPAPANATQLQGLNARFRQVQTGTVIEVPRQLSVVRIGKPNNQTPPDIDVSGFPDSEVVSRRHANLRIEGDVYYLEDVGSSNGTYVNGLPLPVGNRHRLRPGDRIALGKGDKVSFIFETV